MTSKLFSNLFDFNRDGVLDPLEGSAEFAFEEDLFEIEQVEIEGVNLKDIDADVIEELELAGLDIDELSLMDSSELRRVLRECGAEFEESDLEQLGLYAGELSCLDEDELRELVQEPGLDMDDLSEMDENERREAFEEAGLDYNDYDSLFLYDCTEFTDGEELDREEIVEQSTHIEMERLEAYLSGLKESTCPLCGNTDWSATDKVFKIVELGKYDSALPIMPITCENCGNTYFINAIVAGLIDYKK